MSTGIGVAYAALALVGLVLYVYIVLRIDSLGRKVGKGDWVASEKVHDEIESLNAKVDRNYDYMAKMEARLIENVFPAFWKMDMEKVMKELAAASKRAEEAVTEMTRKVDAWRQTEMESGQVSPEALAEWAKNIGGRFMTVEKLTYDGQKRDVDDFLVGPVKIDDRERTMKIDAGASGRGWVFSYGDAARLMRYGQLVSDWGSFMMLYTIERGGE